MDAEEDRRLIELYRYFDPDTDPPHARSDPKAQGPHDARATRTLPDDNGPLGHRDAVDSTLTAFCQLVAIRLGVQRAGVSLVDRDRQYVLAESTPSLDLGLDPFSPTLTTQSWSGWSDRSRHGSVCENTILLPPAQPGHFPCFTVPDLSDDERFSAAPYVIAEPRIRFYCGTPITTSLSFNIGALWAVDDRTLEEPSTEKKQFICTIASLVMKQLEMDRVAVERRRVVKMSKALSYFVVGKMSLSDPEDSSQTTSKSQSASTAGNSSPSGSRNQATSVSQEESKKLDPPEGTGEQVKAMAQKKLPDNSADPANSSPDAYPIANGEIGGAEDFHFERSGSSGPGDAERENDGRTMTYARATNLIREGFDIRCCVIFDSASGFLTSPNSDTGSDTGSDTENELDGDTNIDHESFHRRRPTRGSKLPKSGTTRRRLSGGSAPESKLQADVLGFAGEDLPSLQENLAGTTNGFEILDQKFLAALSHRYPNGRLWRFEEQSFLSSSDDGRVRPFGRQKKRQRSETVILRRVFPGVRQLMFCPIFDNTRGNTKVACFCISNSWVPIFSAQSELVFLKAFLNSLDAELGRLDAIATDRSKTDFIGSISHELRSPLHGILAAAEFLEDTPLNGFQKSLISTQASCSRTLLDVIEHVLDFAKINSLERDARTATKIRSHNQLGSLPHDKRLQNLHAFSDVAELLEEVVEGSAAGRLRQNGHPNLTHMPASIRGSETALDHEKPTVHEISNSDSLLRRSANVAVVVDIEYQQSWVYNTQPGALRRILMNCVGNALKYTASGYVRVQLEARELDARAAKELGTPGNKAGSIISIVVTDTGKGISRDFFRTGLFRPFSQEDRLSSGCGLGLSIVRSLVEMLDGTIQVRSEVNVGTTVSITLPLARPTNHPSEREAADVKSRADLGPTSDSGLPLPQPGGSVAYIGFEVPLQSDKDSNEASSRRTKKAMKDSISKCLTDWLKMRPLDSSESLDNADYVVVLVDEGLSDFIRPYVEDVTKKQPRVIAILEHEMRRQDAESALGKSIQVFEVVSNCLGPRKLANAVASCEQAARRSPSSMRQLAVAHLPFRLGRKLLDSTTAFPRKPEAESIGSGPSQTKQTNEKDVSSPKQVPEDKLSRSSSDHNRRASSKATPHLLLVDDNPLNLKLLETFVRRRGSSVTFDCADDGLAALSNAESRQSGYDIIFMDISMPVMDGLEATRRIRRLERQRHEKQGRSAPRPAYIVALTGLAHARDQAAAFQSGVDLFMTKPVKLKEIGSIIDQWAERRPRVAAISR